MNWVKNLAVAIILIIITSNFLSLNTDNNDNNISMLNNQSIENNNETNNLEESINPVLSSGTRGGYSASFNSSHGGSWEDSFENGTGINWTLTDAHINLSNGEVTPNDNNTVMLNSNFKNGTIWGVPTNWVKEEYSVGTGTFSHNCSLVNSTYQSGNRSVYLYAHVKATSSSPPSKAAYTNLTMDQYVNASLANSVIVHMRGIKYYLFPGWGYNTHIRVKFTDGINESYVPLYWKGQFGYSHDYDSVVKGSDGNNWYKYVAEIPSNINKSHLKVGIFLIGGSWQDSGMWSGVSVYVDNIYFDVFEPEVFSKTITISPNSTWDAVIMKTSQPINTSVEVIILNASNNEQIPGSQKYTSNGDFDISNIDPTTYPSIRLRARLLKNMTAKPILYYWGISWKANNAWQDTFFGGLKIKNLTNVNVTDGSAEFKLGSNLRTNWINIPYGYYYESLLINKSQPSGCYLNATILNSTNNPITGYENFTDESVDISGIDPHIYPSISINTTYFISKSGQSVNLSHWSINWTENTRPKILNATSGPSLNCTESTLISVNMTDLEDQLINLTLQVQYKAPSDTSWQSKYITSTFLNVSHWECTFSTDKDAEPGWYSFRFICNDSFQYQDIVIKTAFINVINNDPSILDLRTSANFLYRGDSIKIFINASDIEKTEENLTIEILYKNPIFGWDTYYIRNLQYINNRWEADFITLVSAATGTYIIRVICNDTYSEVDEFINISVLNNVPEILDIKLSKLQVLRNNTVKIFVNASDIEKSENKLLINVSYKSPVDTQWQTDYIKNTEYINGRWEVIFTPSKSAYTGNYVFNIRCNDTLTEVYSIVNVSVLNNLPSILDISTSVMEINRTFTAKLFIDVADIEIFKDNLTISVSYKSPIDIAWQIINTSNIFYKNGIWEANFTPDKTAKLGEYIFNITCNDTLTEVWGITYIQVKNNLPKLKITTSSQSILRADTLKLFINATDIEISSDQLLINASYRSPSNVTWQFDLISNLKFSNGFWEADFIPPKTAQLGSYMFNISCNDTDEEIFSIISINVLNNQPQLDIGTSVPQAYRTSTIKVLVTSTDVEIPKDQLSVIVKYKSPTDVFWQTAYLSNLIYNNERWEVDFTPPKTAQLGIYLFNITCNDTDCNVYGDVNIPVLNNIPEIIDTSISETNVNRTYSVKVTIDTSDIELSESELVISIKHRFIQDTGWDTNFISNPAYSNGNWEANFTPSIYAPIGTYILNISCDDTDTEVYSEIEVQVLNNKPAQPEILLTPSNPVTTDDIIVEVTNADDIEKSFDQLVFWYRWFRNGNHLPGHDNATTISSQETIKHDTWQCAVFTFDGIDIGPSSSVYTKILNSKPEVKNQIENVQINEDEVDDTSIDLDHIFFDSDDEPLFYSYSGQDRIEVSIDDTTKIVTLVPTADWNGLENLVFTANDTESEETIEITVNVIAVNDPPIISGVQDELTVTASIEKSLDLTSYISDVDNEKSELVLTTNSDHAKVDGFVVTFDYPITISSEAVELKVSDGEDISEPHTILITVISNDKTNPSITEKSPTGENIPVNTTITITFSELMNQFSVENAVTISPSVNGKFNWNNYILIFTPLSVLQINTTYTVTISNTAEDLAGNPLLDNSSWDFTTMVKQMEKKDTDNDGYPDDIDDFPGDPSEWKDTDYDKQGDNKDPDDDNDGISDKDEIILGTDPLLIDTDDDGHNDNEDTFPLDPTKWEKKTSEPEDKSNAGIIIGAIVIIIIVLILLFLFFIKPRMGIKETSPEEKKEEKKEPQVPELKSYGTKQNQYQDLYGDSSSETAQQPPQENPNDISKRYPPY